MVATPETIDLKLLRAFSTVARTLSVTAAAQVLGRPKSAVSKSISELEGLVGVKLLERNSRRVALTSQGVLLLTKAESILEGVERLLADLREDVESASGMVRVTAPPELAAFLARTWVPGFLRAYPHIRLAMHVRYDFDDLFDLQMDIAFRAGHVHDDRLVARRLGAFRRILVASPVYLHTRTIRSPADIAACNCLTHEVASDGALWHLEKPNASSGEHAASQAQVAVRGDFAAKSLVALAEASVAGLGITQIPGFLAEPYLRTGSLVRVLPEWTSPPIPVFVVHRFRHDQIERIRAVIDEAAAKIPGLLSA